MTLIADRRAIGAVAGLGPAALILGYYLATGGPAQPGLLSIVAAPVAAGWLTGQRAGDGTRAGLLAAGAYLIVGYLLNSAIGMAITIWDGAAGVAADQPSVLETISMQGVARIVYFPIWAIVLSPLAFCWMLTVRALSRGFRTRPGGVPTSTESPRLGTQAGSLLWPPLAAVIGYLVGFMLFAPWMCTATQTVGREGPATADSMTVCSSLIGVIYSGHDIYSPPREPAIQAGLTVAAVTFVIILLAVLWMRRGGRVTASR